MDEPEFDEGLIDLPPGKYRLVVEAVGPMIGVSVSKDGTVTHFREEDGERKEWTEHIHESSVRDLLPEWAWDLTLDPRDKTLKHTTPPAS